jgi:hypothetical protein
MSAGTPQLECLLVTGQTAKRNRHSCHLGGIQQSRRSTFNIQPQMVKESVDHFAPSESKDSAEP